MSTAHDPCNFQGSGSAECCWRSVKTVQIRRTAWHVCNTLTTAAPLTKISTREKLTRSRESHGTRRTRRRVAWSCLAKPCINIGNNERNKKACTRSQQEQLSRQGISRSAVHKHRYRPCGFNTMHVTGQRHTGDRKAAHGMPKRLRNLAPDILHQKLKAWSKVTLRTSPAIVIRAVSHNTQVYIILLQRFSNTSRQRRVMSTSGILLPFLPASHVNCAGLLGVHMTHNAGRPPSPSLRSDVYCDNRYLPVAKIERRKLVYCGA